MITLDGASPIPPFEQVRAQIAAQIADGVLVPGTRLPTVRQLAVDLSINANTVARVYAELERAGVIETRRGIGSFVIASPQQASPPDHHRRHHRR